jgi:Domain of unknown function (DUF5625)
MRIRQIVLALAALSASASVGSLYGATPVVNPSLTFPFDVSREGSVLDEEFRLTEYAIYEFVLQFDYENGEDLRHLRGLIGEGSRYPDGRYGNPGIVVPITLHVTRIDAASNKAPSFDGVVQTQGYDFQNLSWQTQGSLNRQIASLILEPGLYKLHAETKETFPQLSERTSLLTITIDHRAVPPKK